MRRDGSGLFRRWAKCAGKPRAINRIRLELVFRRPEEKCAQNPNEIRALPSELVFREVPGKLAQRRRGAEGLSRPVLIALGDSMGDRVAGITGPPTGLRFLAPGLLAVRSTAGALTVADSRVGAEPPPADPAWSLPGIGHARPSSPLRVVNFWRAGVGQFSRAPKNCVRQPFSRSEIGLNKGIVLISRINLFWGIRWKAIPHPLTAETLTVSSGGFSEAALALSEGPTAVWSCLAEVGDAVGRSFCGPC